LGGFLMKRTACVYALAAGTGLAIGASPALAEPAPATVASGLQVNIVPPGNVSNDSTIPLDVKFRGGNIRFVELLIDGTKITRQALSTRDGHGTLHFTLDPTLLSEGSHEILVKAFEADGTCATSTTHMMVTSGDLNAMVRLESPKRNAEVQGIVPIKIKISDSIRNPYVTFNVDKDFLALRNYAPFNYNWDSAKVGNGFHTLSVQVIDGDTSEVVQTITVEVNVKNVGGYTNVQQTVPDVKIPEKGHGGAAANELTGIAQSANPNQNLNLQDVKALSTGTGPGGAFKAGLRKGGSPDRIFPGTAKRSFSNPFTLLPSPLPMKRSLKNPALTSKSIFPTVNPGAAVHHLPEIAGLFASPSDLVTPRLSHGLAHQALRVRRQGIALRPRMEMVSTRTHGVTTAPQSNPSFTSMRTAGKTASRNKRTPAAPLRINRPLKTFDVAFNSAMIHFDVPPRVENGLPLAPFRAIFEHSGGTVKWFNQSKVVRAYTNDREIEIHVGSKDAKVNNKPLQMEATPYLDHGRTIVPLSFIRDSMDVKVTFDPATGHLLIESNK
jgi:hypothetical protein